MLTSYFVRRLMGSSAPKFGRWIRKISAPARRQVSDPLSRGGLALIANTGLTGILGFGYWIIATHLFSTYAVGVAGALVAATTLFSGIGQLNLSGMLIRFLPRAEGKSRRLVLTAYIFAGTMSALLATAAPTVVDFFTSSSSPLRLSLIQSAVFVLAVAATAIFTIEDSVLVGLRRAAWVPVENSAFGVAKIAILFALAPVGTAFALYSSWMIPLTLTIPIISAVLFYGFLSGIHSSACGTLGSKTPVTYHPLRSWRRGGRFVYADLDVSSARFHNRSAGCTDQCLVFHFVSVLQYNRPDCS